MKWVLPILLAVAVILALAPSVVSAHPLVEDEPEKEGSGVDAVLGTLGLYAAMMAVLAVGTEVVVDIVRPLFGLDRKMSPDEAISKVQKWIPGAIKDLGLSEADQERLQKAAAQLDELTAQFGQQSEQVRITIQERWPDIVTDLAVLDKFWPSIKRELQLHLGDEADTQAVYDWLVVAAGQLRALSLADLQNQMNLTSDVMKEIEEQRNRIQGPARKLWRWFRDRLIQWGEYVGGKYVDGDYVPGNWGWSGEHIVRHVLFLPAYLEYVWARFRNKLGGGIKVVEGIKRLGKVQFSPLTSIQAVARRVLAGDVDHRSEERKRVKWLRVFSAIVGVVLAATLRIDSLQLLGPILGSAAETFRQVDESGQVVEWYTVGSFVGLTWRPEQGEPGAQPEASNSTQGPSLWVDTLGNALDTVVAAFLGLTPGIILSGLGAAAGSGFWHDQLDRLRSAKRTVGQMEEIASQVTQPTGGRKSGGG